MRRLIVLLGKNKQGPWVCTAEFGSPSLHVEGLEGKLYLEQGERPEAPPDHVLEVRGTRGKVPIPPARFSRLRRDCSGDILCLITSG